MQYPFSGMIVRFLPKEPNRGCCCMGGACSCDCHSAVIGEPISSSGPDTAAESLPAEVENSNSFQEQKLESTPLKNQLHVNIWEIEEDCFIDVGVMIHDWHKQKYLQVDIPWELKREDISDLGSKLNGEKSVAAIFNEVVHYDGHAEGNFAVISFKQGDSETSRFTLLRLNSQFINVESIYLSGGAVVSRIMIELPRTQVAREEKVIPTPSAYVRFRIRNVPSKVYTQVFKQHDSGIISSSTETRIIDFRINERRGVPDELLTSNNPVKFPKFEKIHCFFTVDRQQDCISQSKNYKGFRSLFDETIWNEYIRKEEGRNSYRRHTVRNYLGHQWTAASSENTQVTDLVVLGRFTRNVSGWVKSAVFVALGLIFGAAGSGIWEMLQGIENCKPNQLSCKENLDALWSISLLSLLAFSLLFFNTTAARSNLKKIRDFIRHLI